MDCIECPICNTKVSKEKIEKHVDNCLKYPKEKPATRRASMSPSANLENYFTKKKSKRKRPSTSEEDTMKKQCVDNSVSNNDNNDDDTTVIPDDDTTVIPDSPPPPLPSIDTECFKVDLDKISIPLPSEGSFQNTLFKWSKMNGSTSASSSSEEKPAKTNKKNQTSGLKTPQTQQLIKMNSKEDRIKEKTGSAQPQRKKQKQKIQLGKTPLADQMRPTDFDHYFGQEAVSSSKVLRDLFCNKIIPSLLLWGPPGCGKVGILILYNSENFEL